MMFSILMSILFVNRKYVNVVNPIFIIFYFAAIIKGFSKALISDKTDMREDPVIKYQTICSGGILLILMCRLLNYICSKML